ncbi:hypothetical protein J6500_17800 [Bradyrhizobium sp. WSM 1704]|uniref:hypothetical protein n=1 Tax=Bradyrhizobium semiaridum TaxID=2821404 RepID=UPI001CE31B9D|nr:hypothetical protein [Bradyrhizobium semiaridum]MCA6123738.1 hypothetical protein [Bradyrhizobium semiaridum]
MARPRLNLSLVLLIATTSLGSAAESTTAGTPDSVVSAERIGCSLRPTAEEPSDPSSTSAISRSEKFTARDHFKEDISSSATVRISWLGATFARRFVGKIEDDVGDVSLQSYVLDTAASDRDILAKLGQSHETRLADVWCLLQRQPSGSSGALRTGATPNIFYVRDAAGELGVVDAIWGGVGWEIGASPVGDKPRWPAGTRAFSR